MVTPSNILFAQVNWYIKKLMPEFLGGFKQKIIESEERWPSGLRRTLGKRVGATLSWVRSHSLRHNY